MIGKAVVDWGEGELKKLGVSQAVNSALVALGLATKATTITTKAAEAAATTPIIAGQTAAEGSKSQAGIPIVGPVLAAAAFAAMFALVMGSLHSAEGGFDIPAGTNPMTQLHQNEMVLPAKYADVIRGMAGNGGGNSNGGGTSTIHIHAMDAQSFSQFIHKNGASVFDSLKHQARNLKR